MIFPTISPVALVLLTTAALAQYSGWDEGQVNATMCMWRLPRVTIVRDTVYVDGGTLFWFQGLETGEYVRNTDLNRRGLMLTLNLTTAFSLSDNQTTLFSTYPRATGADASNLIPYYIDGAALSNDDRILLYGGMTAKSDAYPDPDADDVLQFQAFSPDDEADDADFAPGFVNDDGLPDGLTRYLAYGVGVSAPSESKAWYFSGLHAESKGVIYESYSIPDAVPSNASDTFVSLTFEGDAETWENGTLPDFVTPRGGASGVFLPVGQQGVLVFMGGATFPEFASPSHKSENPAALESESQAFMSTIDLYDIASGTWYQQVTSSETPPILAQGCAVAQHASDFSSFNIYHYGGYKATDQTSPHNDDVWILSLPSFKWVKALSGTEAHARSGHRCVAPYPDQMMVLGGVTPRTGTGTDCLVGGVIQLLNLTSVEWMEGYNPEVFGDYGVPEVLQAEIGGDFSGGATVRSPDGGWDNEALESVFGTPYPTEKIVEWYPYEAAESTDRPNIDDSGDDDDDDGGLPEWVPPTLGAVLGLIFVVVCGVAFIFWRRRKALRRASLVRRSLQEGK